MSKWKTFDSAPKDGTVILLGDNRFSEPAYLMAKWDKNWKYWVTKTTPRGRIQFWRDATHWMPLPTLPALEAK